MRSSRGTKAYFRVCDNVIHNLLSNINRGYLKCAFLNVKIPNPVRWTSSRKGRGLLAKENSKDAGTTNISIDHFVDCRSLSFSPDSSGGTVFLQHQDSIESIKLLFC